MKLLPYDNFYIVTKLSPEKTQKKLQNILVPINSVKARFGGGYNSDGYFMGYSRNENFKFQQVLAYRNSFAPLITGSVSSHQDGSRIHVEMQLLPFVKAFVIIAVGFIIIGDATLFYTDLHNKHLQASSFAPLVMIVFLYLLTILSFTAERWKVKLYLIELFEAEIE